MLGGLSWLVKDYRSSALVGVRVPAPVRHAKPSVLGSARPAASRRRRARSAAVRFSPVRFMTPLAVM